MDKPFMEENASSFPATEEVTILEEETESGETAPKYIVENGIPYVLIGDFYVPDLRAEEAKPAQIGRFGRARLKFLEENRPEEVHRMLLDGNLNETLEQLNELAMDKIRELTTELEKKNPAPDKMKQQLAWVAHMNMLREQATEIIMNELIYA